MRVSILFLGRNGAGPKYAYEMSRALAASSPNSEFQVIIPKTIDNEEDWVELNKRYANLQIAFVQTYRTKAGFLRSLPNFFKYKKIASLIREFRPDWLYLPMGSLLNPGIFLFLKNIKKIYTLHDPNLHAGEESAFIENIRKFEIKNSRKLIILNNFYKNLVSEKYHFPVGKISVIPHSGFFSESQPVYHTDFRYKILFLGRIEKYKGIELLLESFSAVLTKIPNLKLVIAGNGDMKPYEAKLKLIPEDNIEIHNKWLTDGQIEEFIKECDFVVLPYTDASQSGVIPLAFGNGRTVLATDVGALSEQVPEDFGYLAQANPDSVASKILEIYDLNPQNLAEKNEAARVFAEKNLTWESAAKKLMTQLQDEK